MSLDTGRYQLYSTFKTLCAHWDQTRLSWDDAVCREFEEKYWLPLEQHTNNALAAIDRLGQLIVRARQECS